jgi:hypothetical protein
MQDVPNGDLLLDLFGKRSSSESLPNNKDLGIFRKGVFYPIVIKGKVPLGDIRDPSFLPDHSIRAYSVREGKSIDLLLVPR